MTSDVCSKLKKDTQLQRGVSLLMSLLLLVVLSIATVAAIQTGGLQERIAGNTRDRTTTFNAAESALRDAEAYMEKEVNLPVFDGLTQGHYAMNDFGNSLTLSRLPITTSMDSSNPDVWFDPVVIDLIKTKGIKYGTYTGAADLADLPAQPRYLIEQMQPESGKFVSYRVTALATGRDASLVVLQSYYTPPQTTVVNNY
jgi:Tfp pilus assembly protein PilX